MTQFIKINKDILSSSNLNANDKLIYSLLMDRLESSKQRTQFYDKEMKDYFVIYTIAELAEFLSVSPTTVVKSYKKLVSLGLLIKKTVFNGATKLFLPDHVIEETEVAKETNNDDVITETGMPKLQKMSSNHTNLNQTDSTGETEDTKNVEFEILKNSINEIGGFDLRTTNIIASLSFNNYEEMHNIVGTIYKAKRNVLNKHKSFKQAKSALTLESDNFKDLAEITKNILIHANHSKNKHGYIYKAFYNHFQHIIQLAKLNDKPEIPIFEIA